MASPTLCGMPPELQSLVVTSFLRKSDLAIACLTNKALYAAALPELYRMVTADRLRGYPRLSSFFTAGNSGHKYVRQLSFVPRSDVSTKKKSYTSAALRAIKIALVVLPEDVLESLSMPDHVAPDICLIIDLATRQRKLKRLQLGGPLSPPVLTALNSKCCAPTWLTTLRFLATARKISGLQDLQWYNKVIQNASQLEGLTITDSVITGKDVPTSSETTRDLVETLFSHIVPYGNAPALQLKDLGLVNITVFAPRLLDVLDLRQLTSLTLWYCSHDMALLSALAGVFKTHTYALEWFNYVGSARNYSSLELFCREAPPLRYLLLECRYGTSQESFDPDCVSKHLPVLKTFGLTLPNTTEAGTLKMMPPNQAMLDKLHTLGQGLKSLAVSMPATAVSSSMSLGYKTALASLCPKGCFGGMFNTATAEFAKLQRHRYLQLLDTFATQLLRLISSYRREYELPSILAVAFGAEMGRPEVYEKGAHVGIEFDSVCYVVGTQTDAYGYSEIVAIRKTPVEFNDTCEENAIIDNFH